MKPHPRIRKTIKWGGAAVTVLLLVMYLGSGRFLCEWRGRGGTHAFAGWGCFVVAHSRPLFQTESSGPHMTRLSRYSLDGTLGWTSQLTGWSIQIPIWPLAAAAGVATCAAWLIDHRVRLRERRIHAGCCPDCGYDRTGILRDAKCPECGAVLASEEVADS